MSAPTEFAFIPSPTEPPEVEYSIDTEHITTALRVTRSVVFETPLVPAHCLFGETAWTQRTGVKLENLQRTGSFKVRGAVAVMATLRAGGDGRAVITASSGHHGLAVAFAARRLGLPATVVVPREAPRGVRDALALEGAEVLAHDGSLRESEAFAMDLARSRAVHYISAFDDPMVMAGNGATLGAELAGMDNGRGPSEVIVPVGGGGLAAGLRAGLLAAGIANPRVMGAQAAERAAMAVSFERNEAVHEVEGDTIAQSLRAGVSTGSFALAARALTGVVLVPEFEIAEAVAMARRAGLVIDPGAAVALAAARALSVPESGRRVVVLTGRPLV